MLEGNIGVEPNLGHRETAFNHIRLCMEEDNKNIKL
jgi:hypothetical protein